MQYIFIILNHPSNREPHFAMLPVLLDQNMKIARWAVSDTWSAASHPSLSAWLRTYTYSFENRRNNSQNRNEDPGNLL